jgi:uncharacterized membrane protein YfcA
LIVHIKHLSLMKSKTQFRTSRFLLHPVVIFSSVLLSALLIYLLFVVPDPVKLLSDYGQFFLFGLAGAIVANSTGAGGGVVFIPAFTTLGIEGINALGTSLAIQCFGMTAGSISWLLSIHRHDHGGKEVVNLTHRLLLISSISAVIGMLSGQYLLPPPSWHITTIFKYFSIIFGIILLIVTLKKNKNRHTRYRVARRDVPLILFVCYVGGVVTSWISVGVGEWLAILLFFLGYPTMVTVCVAVCLSSIVVLSGIPYHVFWADSIVWQILLFAAPAAIVGGLIARYLSERLGPIRLKVFFAAWILATGLAM